MTNLVIDHSLTDALRGKIIGIDALVRNALIVADGECALRLIGIIELAADAMQLVGESPNG